MTQQPELLGKPDLVRFAPARRDQRQLLRGQHVMARELFSIDRDPE